MGEKRMVRSALGLMIVGLLVSCSAKPAPPLVLSERFVSRCEAIFVLAPTQFMRYMDFSEHPMLASEGREQDLPVFCTSKEAREARNALEAANRLPAKFWSVFRLDGVWENDVVEVETGEFRMRHPALLFAKANDNT